MMNRLNTLSGCPVMGASMTMVKFGAGCCAWDAEQTSNRLKAGRFHNLMAASPNLVTIVTKLVQHCKAAPSEPLMRRSNARQPHQLRYCGRHFVGLARAGGLQDFATEAVLPDSCFLSRR